jgi:NADH dehydrogenase/NADH:ubiquinone oxidoreductase subunit G
MIAVNLMQLKLIKRRLVMKIKVTIDNKIAEVERETTILEAAKSLGIKIPTLCFHEALSPYGSCRLCLVEVKRGNKTEVTTSCNYPITKEIEVVTNSEKVLKYRRMVLQLLLGRCPDNPVLLEIAEEFGIEQPIFDADEYDDCILCGRCERACREVVGANAITFSGRGVKRKVEAPFGDYNDLCIACGACAFVCPTGAVQVQFDGENKIIDKWEKVSPLIEVENSGQGIMTEAQIKYFQDKFHFNPIIKK